MFSCCSADAPSAVACQNHSAVLGGATSSPGASPARDDDVKKSLKASPAATNPTTPDNGDVTSSTEDGGFSSHHLEEDNIILVETHASSTEEDEDEVGRLGAARPNYGPNSPSNSNIIVEEDEEVEEKEEPEKAVEKSSPAALGSYLSAASPTPNAQRRPEEQDTVVTDNRSRQNQQQELQNQQDEQENEQEDHVDNDQDGQTEEVEADTTPKVHPALASPRILLDDADADDDLNDDQDQGRNPPLYKHNPAKRVAAKMQWLEKAFSPEGAGQFPDSPTSTKSSNGTNETTSPSTSPSNSKPTPAVSTAAVSSAVAVWQAKSTDNTQQQPGGTVVTPNPSPRRHINTSPSSTEPLMRRIPSTYTGSSAMHSSPSSPVTYRSLHANSNLDSAELERAYELWYQKGLLSWRLAKYQANADDADEEPSKLPQPQEEQDLAADAAAQKENQDALTVNTSVKKQQLDVSSSFRAADRKRMSSSRKNVLRTSRRVPIVSLFGSAALPRPRKVSPATKAVAAASSLKTPPSSPKRSSPDSTTLSPSERVEYYQNYVNSFQAYRQERHSPKAQHLRNYALHQLNSTKSPESTTTTTTGSNQE